MQVSSFVARDVDLATNSEQANQQGSCVSLFRKITKEKRMKTPNYSPRASEETNAVGGVAMKETRHRLVLNDSGQ